MHLKPAMAIDACKTLFAYDIIVAIKPIGPGESSMSKVLVIAEKPSVAVDLAKVLGRFDKKDGYLENEKFIVSWAFGHLLELAEPADYDPMWKKWSIEQLPILPESFQLREIASGRKQLGTLKKLLLSKDVRGVIDACDSGREGEHIFRCIYKASGSDKPTKRLWLSEATPAAVREAFRNLRDGRDLDSLAAAAEARSQADWIVGINATRAFTCRHGRLLSLGRVQTPTLALVVNRERDIRAFKPTPYWELWANFQKENGETYRGKWIKGKVNRLDNQGEALAILARLGSQGEVVRVEQKEVREQPPTLLNLNDLQREANKKYGLTAQQTLDIAQALYERHKLLTYPRTDSRHLTEAIVKDTLAARLAALAGSSEYSSLVPKILPSLGKRYVDGSKVTDHHAIIPTAAKPNLSALGTNEKLVYDLAVRRFLAIMYPDARYAVTKADTQVSGEIFQSSGRVELDIGWKQVYKPDEDEKKDDDREILPSLVQGEKVVKIKADAIEKTTKPPSRYTEATLLAAMENAGRFAKDDDLADTLKETGGIGTPATRASIIETLIRRTYMLRDKKALLPTPDGETLIDLAPELLKSVEMTASWENGLIEIERSKQDALAWMDGIKKFTRDVVDIARGQEQTRMSASGSGGREAIGKCPLCGRDVVDYPKSYGCSGYREGCKFAIWKEIAKKKITAKQASDLLGKGRTGELKGFKSKAGKDFQAILVLGAAGKVAFEFVNQLR
jgi:DNA topoisomerase-3